MNLQRLRVVIVVRVEIGPLTAPSTPTRFANLPHQKRIPNPRTGGDFYSISLAVLLRILGLLLAIGSAGPATRSAKSLPVPVPPIIALGRPASAALSAKAIRTRGTRLEGVGRFLLTTV
jgi:hypothetical protein